MKVKICGLTRKDDIELAHSLGAWALGFVFYHKSPRYIEPQFVASLLKNIPLSLHRVGVFVNAAHDDILFASESVGLTCLQLHGEETPEDCALLKARFDGRLIKAFAPRKEKDMAHLSEYEAADYFLIDAFDTKARGGTGKKADWTLAKDAKKYGEVILAGGLSSDNVRKAMDAVNPFALDVSSGVESAPGIKDAEKMKQLFETLQTENKS